MVAEQVTVDSFLRSLGLEKYAILFKAEEVDMYSLKRMAEEDLKEMGIPMRPRKKILLVATSSETTSLMSLYIAWGHIPSYNTAEINRDLPFVAGLRVLTN
ncbi:hypothetical protein OROGR_003601 [Orobanche gracilis]